jgi:hypothetical protein
MIILDEVRGMAIQACLPTQSMICDKSSSLKFGELMNVGSKCCPAPITGQRLQLAAAALATLIPVLPEAVEIMFSTARSPNLARLLIGRRATDLNG